MDSPPFQSFVVEAFSKLSSAPWLPALLHLLVQHLLVAWVEGLSLGLRVVACRLWVTPLAETSSSAVSAQFPRRPFWEHLGAGSGSGGSFLPMRVRIASRTTSSIYCRISFSASAGLRLEAAAGGHQASVELEGARITRTARL